VHVQRLMPWGSAPAAALPRVAAEALADVAGTLAWAASPRSRRIVAANLNAVAGRAGARLVSGVFRTYSRYYLSMLRLAHLAPLRATGPYRWEGRDALDTSLAAGRGALVLSAHFGNWDLIALALTEMADVCIFVEPIEPAAVFEYYRGVRARHGVRVAVVGRPGRAARETLARNGVLGLLADRGFGSRRSTVRAGRALIDMPTGAVRLALRHGAAIHPVFARREHREWVIRCGPDCAAGARALADPEAQVRAVGERFAAALTAAVRAAPEQWCLFPRLTIAANHDVGRAA